MSTKLLSLAGSAVVAGMAIAAPAEAASLVLDLEPGGTPTPCGICGNISGQTYGWNFDVSDTIQVDGLGVWDFGADGIGPDVQVGLWDNAGSLLASTAITNASSPQASNNLGGVWLFEDIATQTLTAGRYAIGATFFNSTPLAQFGAPTTTIPEVTLVGGSRSGSPDSGLSFPSTPFQPIFGPTLRVAEPSASVPEPASLLGLAAIAGIGFVARRKSVEEA